MFDSGFINPLCPQPDSHDENAQDAYMEACHKTPDELTAGDWEIIDTNAAASVAACEGH